MSKGYTIMENELLKNKIVEYVRENPYVSGFNISMYIKRNPQYTYGFLECLVEVGRLSVVIKGKTLREYVVL